MVSRATAVNTPPTADAGPDQTVASGSSVSLPGSGSDADGDTLGYTVTNGVDSTTISGATAGATAEIGRFSLSSEIEIPVAPGVGSPILFVTPQLDWGFIANGSSSIDDGISGSLEVGIKTAPGHRWRGEVALRYDGIGQGDFEALSVRSSLNFKF